MDATQRAQIVLVPVRADVGAIEARCGDEAGEEGRKEEDGSRGYPHGGEGDTSYQSGQRQSRVLSG